MTPLQRAMRDLLGPLRPHKAIGRDKVRIGGRHDGGYVMLDDFSGIKQAVGCGVGWDVSFEYDLAERGIEVELFDHTVAAPPRGHQRFWFHRRKISGRPQHDVPWIDLDGIAHRLQAPAGDALLKVDIEGDEWPLFALASHAALQRYRQIVCEIHDLQKVVEPPFLTTALAAIGNLTRDFAVVHVHANNNGNVLGCGDGMLVPSVLELSFASRAHYRMTPETEEFPTALDAANDPKKPDIWLGRFDFSEAAPPSPWWKFWDKGRKT